MRTHELGARVRQARNGLGMTQAEVATRAGVSRVTLNQLENGLFPDLGIRKVAAVLREVGLELDVHTRPAKVPKSFVRMACITASVSFRESLTEDELIRVLLTGKVPEARRPHLRVLVNEAPPALLKGLVEELSRSTKPGRVEKNLAKVVEALR